jgi:tetratricopeptide (TPR) repeat protein/tRNA A-37 threonylcarbamoyl transferase component Bud32
MLQTPNTTNASAYVPPTDPIAPLRAALRGHYDIEREIGQGAFATVYLARDLKHERKVAVKVLNADPTSDIGELRFIREIRTLARLQHPNILPLHDSGHVEAMLYYVMPYVSGDTVRDRIDREKQMSIEAACSIARDVADALAYAHAQGIIHRDIKPENILLSTGHPILADFGIARAIDLAGVRQLTRTGAASPGTPAYMSPEQLMGDKELDGRSDTYSLGCVLFEMVTGKPPFAGKEGFVKRFTEPPPRASTLRKGLPGWLDDAIEKALQREPRDRYPTAKEFLAALFAPPLESSAASAPLNKRLDTTFAPSAVEGAPAGGSERVTQWREAITSHHRLVWFAAAAVVASAVIAGFASRGEDWSRILGLAPAPDPTKVVILPLRGEPTRGDVIARNLRESLTKWQGLYVVSDLELADAMRGTTLTSLNDARAVARSLGAGKLVWGQVAGTPDSGRVRVELYDLSSAVPVPPRAYTVESGNPGDQSYSNAAIALMKDPERPATADGGDRGTRSYHAWVAYGAGHIALARWDLPSALQAFKESVIADPNYAAARLWLAQVAAWKSRDATVNWRAEARRALSERSALSLRDSLLGEGLAALAEGRFAQACASYRHVSSVDPSDFAGWYGLGQCQSLDQAVIPDRKSPSGMRFRSSYHAAVLDYQRAFRIAPETHSWLPSSQLERLLPATPTLVRFGQNASGAYFMAYPSLSADTIAFVPYPDVTFAALPPAAMETLGAALDRNSEIRRDIALEWVRVSPENADAYEALADVLESRGDLTALGRTSLSAMSALGRAQELASSDEQKLRLMAREVRLLFKLGSFAEATALADSVLARYDGGSVGDARELAPVAAMVGKIGKLAQFVRSGSLQTASVNIPAPLQEIGATFFSRAALGACDNDLADSRQLLEQRLDSYIAEENRSEVRAALEWRPLSLAAPCSGGKSALAITAPEDRLYRMQQSFARGDFKTVRDAFNELARTRRGMRAGDISLDYTYQEAWLRAAIGDTVLAIKTLSLALNALPTLSAPALKEPAAAAAAGRAMMLAADLASATGDKRSARRWAGAVADLWKNADPALQPSVSRMRALRNTRGAQ